MCGRAAQTALIETAVRKVEASLSQGNKSTVALDFGNNNYNVSPGMDCVVMSMNDDGELRVDLKKWGLLSKHGTIKKPLYKDEKDIIKMCFESLCYNSRSDTLYSKPTFSRLALRGRTCVVALDGYFEWKPNPIPKLDKRKQPYFVYSRQREPLLIAGLWTRVATGIPNSPELDSFTMLTTEASSQIEWLHHRMPVCIWDIELAKRWLTQPSENLKKEIDNAARRNNDGFAWHKVTPEMSKLSFRGKDAIKEMKETTQSVKNFFAKATGKSGEEKAKNASTFREKEEKGPDRNASEEKNRSIEMKLAPGTVTTDKKSHPPTSGVHKIVASPPSTRDSRKRSTSTPAHVLPNKRYGSTKSIATNKASKNQIPISSFFQKKK